MASRAEIEAQIAALKAVLKAKEIDPDFTPKELVRWDPSLLGTMLHMKHPMNLPRTAFQYIFKNVSVDEPDKLYGDINNISYNFQNCNPEAYMQQFVVLSIDGIDVNDSITGGGNTYYDVLLYNKYNDFAAMTSIPFWCKTKGEEFGPGHRQDYRWKNLNNLVPLDTFDIKFKNGLGYLRLCGPDDNILDHIYITSVVKYPFQTKEVIIDKYPLSKLYEEWKADRAAGRTQRGA